MHGAAQKPPSKIYPVSIALNDMRDIDAIFREIESVPDFIGHSVTSVIYKDGYGDTPLHVVSGWGDCEAIRLLVASGALIDEPGEGGYTPLHCAVEQSHPEAVALLLELGARIRNDNDGLNPIQLAEALEDQACLEVLWLGI